MKRIIKNAISSMKQLVIKWLAPSSKTGFTLLAGLNRRIISGQIDKMAESIKKMGIIRPVVVAVIDFINGKKETAIIDGQHLYLACLRLGIPVPYTYIEVKDKKDLIEKIALLNSSSKSWTLNDYVTAWSNHHDDYKKLNHYSDKFGIETSVVASVMSGSVGFTGGVINRKIKEGMFRVKDEAHNLQLLSQVKDILALLPRASRFGTKYLCNEYLTFVKNCPATGVNRYNHDKFLKNVKANSEMLGAALQSESKLVTIFQKLNKLN